MAHTLLSLGSNLHDPETHVRRAFDELSHFPQTWLLKASGLYPTRPVGGRAGQSEFQNAAALLETRLPPLQLLDLMQQLEQRFGRTPGSRWGPRTLDLDLLLYNERVVDEPLLQIPHPRMSFRRFVLDPAVEIAAEMKHPPIGVTVGELQAHLVHSVPRIDVVGLAIPPKQALLAQVCTRLPDTLPRVCALDPWESAESDFPAAGKTKTKFWTAVDSERPIPVIEPPRVLVLLLFGPQHLGSSRMEQDRQHRLQEALRQRFERFRGPRLVIDFDAREPTAEQELIAVAEAAASPAA